MKFESRSSVRPSLRPFLTGCAGLYAIQYLRVACPIGRCRNHLARARFGTRASGAGQRTSVSPRHPLDRGEHAIELDHRGVETVVAQCPGVGVANRVSLTASATSFAASSVSM